MEGGGELKRSFELRLKGEKSSGVHSVSDATLNRLENEMKPLARVHTKKEGFLLMDVLFGQCERMCNK